jgi:hypothetical protein
MGGCTERRLIAGRLDILSSTGRARKSVVNTFAVVGFCHLGLVQGAVMITRQLAQTRGFPAFVMDKPQSQPIKLLAYDPRRRDISAIDQRLYKSISTNTTILPISPEINQRKDNNNFQRITKRLIDQFLLPQRHNGPKHPHHWSCWLHVSQLPSGFFHANSFIVAALL